MTWLRFVPYAAIAALLLGVAWWLYDAGGDATRADQLEQTNQTQRRITDADARGPRTPDDVDLRLRDGTF
jgi:hypothetical protein